MPSFMDRPATSIPGVGPERARTLQGIGIRTVRELLYHFPLRFEDIAPRPFEELREGERTTVEAVIAGPAAVRYAGSRSRTTVPVLVQGRRIQAVFFNRSYLRDRLREGESYRLTGRYDSRWRSFLAASLEPIRSQPEGSLRPVYRLPGNVPAASFRKMVEAALRVFRGEIGDGLPLELRERFRLPGLADALRAMHFPKSEKEWRLARRRIVFEEFLRFQLRVQGFRRARVDLRVDPVDGERLAQASESFTRSLPYELTLGQRQALRDVMEDISSDRPMNRLLEGDVGSGKTAVALAAAASLAAAGLQTALMAPTTLLAWQHYQTARSLLEPLGVGVVYLGGSQDAASRRDALDALESGRASVAVGTHALAGDEVRFSSLRLAVIDEQHRFGVGVRRLLRGKGEAVDLLQLSATPIPRTLALTLYGDVEFSVIRELPPGRRPVETVLVPPSREAEALRAVRRELAKGRQAFIVAPRIEVGEADEFGAEAAVSLHRRMEEELAGWPVGLLHGDLPEEQRSTVMRSFVQGTLKALVATTIVEVGVDVPEATAMVVYGADRFGLSTLHQLRGRVGRSGHPSRCYLIADPGSETAKARLRALLETSDGFALAEQDLRLRGPGEAFGERQAGLPSFYAGDAVADRGVMEAARDIARELLAAPDFWILPAFGELRKDALDELPEFADS